MANTDQYKVVAVNKKARHDYTIEETLEAGIVLQGTEVKSLRLGNANIKDSYAGEMSGEIWAYGIHITEYKHGNRYNHNPTRPRKLLLKAKEIRKLIGKIKTKGTTLVPLKLYFNAKGLVKLELGLASGKKQHEKRQAIKERDWKREQGRLLRDKG